MLQQSKFQVNYNLNVKNKLLKNKLRVSIYLILDGKSIYAHLQRRLTKVTQVYVKLVKSE